MKWDPEKSCTFSHQWSLKITVCIVNVCLWTPSPRHLLLCPAGAVWCGLFSLKCTEEKKSHLTLILWPNSTPSLYHDICLGNRKKWGRLRPLWPPTAESSAPWYYFSKETPSLFLGVILTDRGLRVLLGSQHSALPHEPLLKLLVLGEALCLGFHGLTALSLLPDFGCLSCTVA